MTHTHFYCLAVATTHQICEFFVALVRDELKLKYAGNRILKYSDIESERVAICWLNVQMGWTLRASNYEQAARIPNHLNSQPEK